jgi:hypothetical protein
MTAFVAGGATLRLPDGWAEVDLHAADPLDGVREPADADTDELVGNAIAPAIAELRRLSENADILGAAFTCEIVDVPGRAEPGLLCACLTLAVSPPVGGLADVRRDLATLDTEVDIRTVPLAAGTSVLVAGAIEVHVTDQLGHRVPLPARLFRYFVPIPGLDRLAVLSFLTPNEDAKDEFGVVFAAIADSLRFQRAC